MPKLLCSETTVISLESTLPIWEAVSVKCVRPFEPHLLPQATLQSFHLGNDLHQGGWLLNNSSALTLHERKYLLPDVLLECIVSPGTGRYERHVRDTVIDISSKTKWSNVTDSATDTEVHIVLDDLLLPDPSYKFSPIMCGNIPLDGSQNEKLQLERLTYIKRNEEENENACKNTKSRKRNFAENQ